MTVVLVVLLVLFNLLLIANYWQAVRMIRSINLQNILTRYSLMQVQDQPVDDVTKFHIVENEESNEE